MKPWSLSPARMCAVLAMTGLLSMQAQAGLFDDDEARRAILDLRQKIDLAQKNQAEKNAQTAEELTQLRQSLLDLQAQIESVRRDNAVLRGQNEQLAREITLLQQQQQSSQQAVDDRLKQFEPVKVTVDGREFMADPAEKRDYETALKPFRSGDYAASQSLLSAFTKRYPNSGYMPSVQFWLGNSAYANKDPKEAIGQFKAMLAAAPSHARAPDALLTMAQCQQDLKENAAAKKTLQELMRLHPESEAAQAAKTRLARMR